MCWFGSFAGVTKKLRSGFVTSCGDDRASSSRNLVVALSCLKLNDQRFSKGEVRMVAKARPYLSRCLVLETVCVHSQADITYYFRDLFLCICVCLSIGQMCIGTHGGWERAPEAPGARIIGSSGASLSEC